MERLNDYVLFDRKYDMLALEFSAVYHIVWQSLKMKDNI